MNDNKEMLAKTIIGLRNLKPFVKGKLSNNHDFNTVVMKGDIKNIAFVNEALKHMHITFNNGNKLQMNDSFNNRLVTYDTLSFLINIEIEDMLLTQLFEYGILKKPENEV